MKNLFSSAAFAVLALGFSATHAGVGGSKKSRSNISNNRTTVGAGACQASCRENNQGNPDALAACLRECDVVGPAAGAVTEPRDAATGQASGKRESSAPSVSEASSLSATSETPVSDSAGVRTNKGKPAVHVLEVNAGETCCDGPQTKTKSDSGGKSAQDSMMAQ